MVLKWHLKIVQLVSGNQNQFVNVSNFVSLLLKKEERESLCLTPFLLLKVLFNSYLTQPPFIRFKWANKSIVLVCLIMFVVLFAMSIWNLDSVVADEIVNRLPLQWVGHISWNHWSTLLLFGILIA